MMKCKCRNCGIKYESSQGIVGGFCNNSCRIRNLEKYRIESIKLQKQLYRKYFK